MTQREKGRAGRLAIANVGARDVTVDGATYKGADALQFHQGVLADLEAVSNRRDLRAALDRIDLVGAAEAAGRLGREELRLLLEHLAHRERPAPAA